MTETTRNDELLRLRQELTKAEGEYEYCSLANAANRTAEELIALDLAYRRAELRLAKARRAYDDAILAAAKAG